MLNVTKCCRHIAQQQLRISNKFPIRFASTTNSNSKFLLQKLEKRSVIRLKGELVQDFLQSLITNDMNHFVNNPATSSIFTMFLNKNGRVLYDSIIYKSKLQENTYLIECDRDITEELQKHLKLFRVRKKIDIDPIDDESSVWVAFNPNAYEFGKPQKENEPISLEMVNELPKKGVLLSNDPRVKYLGTRIIAPSDYRIEEQLDLPLTDQYQKYRYQLGIGEGIEELPPTKCFPLESNCDYLHGVSFHKGCYLGQEFTARTHHTGVIRKRLMPIHILNGQLPVESSKQIETTHGVAVGKIRGTIENWAIGLVKYEVALNESAPLVFGGSSLMVNGVVSKPFWWPTEAPKLQALKSP